MLQPNALFVEQKVIMCLYHLQLPASTKPSVLIQGAMDNVDHEENTSSETGGSHDTILVLFQNSENTDQDKVDKKFHPTTRQEKLLHRKILVTVQQMNV